MMKVIKKVLILMLVTMMMGMTMIVNYSNAAEGIAGKAQVVENKEFALTRAKTAYTNNSGKGLKLNRAPSMDFDEKIYKDRKVKAIIQDGSEIKKFTMQVLDSKLVKKEIELAKGIKEHKIAFNDPDKNKTKKMEFILKDRDGLTSKVQCKVKNNNGKEYTFNVSMRMSLSYDKKTGMLNIILRDNNGINDKDATLEVIDKVADRTVAEVKGKEIKLVNTVKYDGKPIYGEYQVSIKKLKVGKDGKYFINVKTTDADGYKGYRMAKFTLE